MTSIKVIYKEVPDGEIAIDPGLDERIRKFFESEGFEWTGQGFDFQSQTRDIGFKSEEYRLCAPPTSEEGEGGQ